MSNFKRAELYILQIFIRGYQNALFTLKYYPLANKVYEVRGFKLEVT